MSYSRLVDKTGPLKYTNHYVYNNADCLGKGATATVYLGRHREAGDVVAIKVFDDRGSHQINAARKRELGLLRSISHQNVMRFIACEDELATGQQVLVMEYCQGGSLFILLEQPQTAFGFPEEDFLKFLKDTSCGLKYLWSNGIVHRDIKPGNIMKRIEDDGSISYVVTDFGAARELAEEETFMSIYGTEEYIHPNMFQRAVLRQPGQQHFNSSVDLWSLGVTIYHVATGRLPFKAFGGRSNAQTMFQITSNRESGVISGVQKQQNGHIEWSRELPVTCHLSRSLRKLLEPVLAGLFESDPTKALTFDTYFDLVSDIVNMRRIMVFNYQSASNIAVYIRKTESHVHLQERIAGLTDIPSGRQLLLISHKQLHDIIDIHDQIQTYPKSVLSANIFLYEKDNSEFHRLLVPDIPHFPSLPVDSSLNNDAIISKKCSAVAYFIESKTSEVLKNQTLLQESLLNIRHFIKDKLQPIELCVPDMMRMLTISGKRLDSLVVSQKNTELVWKLVEFIDATFQCEKGATNYLNGFNSDDKGLQEVISKANTRVAEIKLYMSVLVQKMQEQAFSQPMDNNSCHEEDICLTKVQHLRQNIQGVSATFLKHKKYGELHEHEKFIHGVERHKLEDLCVKILSMYQGHCVHNLSLVHASVQKQISILLKHLARAGKVETNVRCVAECQGQINEKIDKIDEHYKRISESSAARIQSILSSGNQLLLTQITLGASPMSGKQEAAKSEDSDAKSQKMYLMERLHSEMESLQLETSEIDGLMKSNIDSLVELKMLLQEQGLPLNPTSINQENKLDSS